MSVNDSHIVLPNCDGPPNPVQALIIDRAKSKPKFLLGFLNDGAFQVRTRHVLRLT